MNTPQPDPNNPITITPADQRKAIEITEAAVHGDGEMFGDLLADLATGEPDRHHAVTAILSRNLAVTLVANHGRQEALRILESTRLDAAVADEDADE